MSWLFAAIGSLAAALIGYQVLEARRLQHIPGPRLAPWTNFWLVYSQLTGRIHLILHQLIEQHGKSPCIPTAYLRTHADRIGPVARIAPKWVVCGDPTEIRRIWAARSPWIRGEWYRGMRIDPYRDSSFSTRSDDLHGAIRQKLLPGYSGHDVDNVHGLIDEQVKRFVDLIDTYLDTSGGSCVIDMAQKVQYFALDTISSLAFGDSFGFLKQDEDKFRYIETTGQTVYILVATTLIPGMVRTMQSPYLKWLAPSVKDMAGIGDVIRFAERAVGQRFGANAMIQRDMLGSFVKHGLGQKDAEAEALVQIIAGSETTATAIQATILHIITTPRVYRRLQDELDEAITAGRISSPITNDEAENFKYLKAIILEGIRIFPPAAALYPKVSHKDQVICGVHIPAGTNVSWSPWSIMRNVAIFGEDAALFRPERWMEDNRPKDMERTVMMAFAMGSRWECLGKNIAMIELNKIFVEVSITIRWTFQARWKQY